MLLLFSFKIRYIRKKRKKTKIQTYWFWPRNKTLYHYFLCQIYCFQSHLFSSTGKKENMAGITVKDIATVSRAKFSNESSGSGKQMLMFSSIHPLYCEDSYISLTVWRVITRPDLILVFQITVLENRLCRVKMCHLFCLVHFVLCWWSYTKLLLLSHYVQHYGEFLHNVKKWF